MPIDVLWVEEEPQSLRYERRLAELQGWRIPSADTVSGAMELINGTRFDLVVADLILPEDDFDKERGVVTPNVGIQLIKWVRETTRQGKTPPDVPLLVITAVISPEQRFRVVDIVGSDRYYLNKPLSEDDCLRTFSELTEALKPSMRNQS